LSVPLWLRANRSVTSGSESGVSEMLSMPTSTRNAENFVLWEEST
jgi:hypothetical protein